MPIGQWSLDTVGESQLRAITIFAKQTLKLGFYNQHQRIMPRPTLNLQPFKGLITTWFHDGLTSEDIAKKLTDEYNTPCATRTIKCRLSEQSTAKRV